jgi:hypothetical protein
MLAGLATKGDRPRPKPTPLPASLGPPGLRGRSPAQRLPCGPVTCGRYAKLDLEKRTRDLALFNLAIDSKLRGCDLVALRVDDVAPNGYAIDRANFSQRKSGRPARFEPTADTAAYRRWDQANVMPARIWRAMWCEPQPATRTTRQPAPWRADAARWRRARRDRRGVKCSCRCRSRGGDWI